tara:strand:+ start:139 stop:345 length:207 start_codon:yes stop_codon:yes gene_type:complete
MLPMKTGIEKSIHEVNQGDCVRLTSSKSLFQVIGIDNIHNKCWVREWPMVENGAKVFEIHTKEISKIL